VMQALRQNRCAWEFVSDELQLEIINLWIQHMENSQ